MAFDILPMSSPMKSGNYFALTIKEDEDSVQQIPKISRKKLLASIRKIRPRYVGTDNPHEFLKPGETIAQFCRNLPSTTSLVHVNLSSAGKPISLGKLIRQYLPSSNGRKPSPLETSNILIQLMEQKIGMIIEPFEEETLISIGRPRSSGKGGWSQARYERQGEEILGRAAKIVKGKLDEHKVEYDEITNVTTHGAKSSRFHIFRSMVDIESIISRKDIFPAKMRIWSPRKKILSYRPIEKSVSREIQKKSIGSSRRVIIGIDPGMATGLAIIDLVKRVLHIQSKKNFSKGDIINTIMEFGVPILVCADVNPVPNLVKKIASTFSVPIEHPDVLLSKQDKNALIKEIEINRKRIDSHEKDALAAVIYTFKKFESSFEKLSEYDLGARERLEVKSLIIQGYSIKESVNNVKSMSTEVYEAVELAGEAKPSLEELLETNKIYKNRINNLLVELNSKDELIHNLRSHGNRLENNLFMQGKRLQKLFKENQERKMTITRDVLEEEIVEEKERTIDYLNRKYKKLEDEFLRRTRQIEELEKLLWVKVDIDGYPVKIIRKINYELLSRFIDRNEIRPGDILYIHNKSAFGRKTTHKLIELKPKIIFLTHALPEHIASIFFTHKLPVVGSVKYDIQVSQSIGVISTNNLQLALNDYQNMLEDYEKRLMQEKIDKAISNYKFEREEEVKKLHSDINYDDFEGEEYPENEVY